ncbi:WD repeat-containing protein 60 [Holothuria leucospilota]|uniref:WD repeat-containing protein 60 n=1 Tax=Holothuria leucospilota TaxID=206669 RepID=A0A9Q1C0F4_HOLLE|nr:WD repeat-containing protein 60 [Holothuria leucospilota]
MPSRTEKPKGRSKEDTWGAPELTSTIQDANADRERKVRDKDRERRRDRHEEDKGNRDRDKDRTKERKEEKHSREDRQRSSKEKTKDASDRKRDHRDREGSSRDERSKDERHRSKDKDREERHRNREEDNRDRERRREKREGDDRERRSGKSSHRDKDEERRERKERDDKENRRGERDSHRDRDEDRKERREERHRRKDHSGSRGENSEKDRKREKERSAKDKERRSHRGETEDSDSRHEEKRSKHKERDSDDKRRHEDKEERRRRREAEKDRESSGRDKNRSKEDEDEERERRRRKEEKRRREKEKEEQDEKKKSERLKSKSKEKIEDEIEEHNDEDQEAGANDYEDDFEDYEDDFEDEEADEDAPEYDSKEENDIDESTLTELRRAMEAENQASSQSGRASYSQEHSSAGSTRPATSTKRTFINFVAAKQRQISNTVAERTKKRGQVLMKLIELDTVTFDLFDMPPVKDYERFIQFFGRSDSRQVAVQCNDDNLDREVQTEDVEYREKWCQHPAEGVRCSGGNDETLEEDLEFAINQEAHSVRLTEFIQTAGQLMAVLLEESRIESGGKLQSNQRSIVFSEGYTQLKAEFPFLKGRPVCEIQVHPVQTHLILTAYSQAKIPNDEIVLSNRGILCVWNINDPLKPQKILSCRSHLKCCAWSPTKATMAFAGTEDGSVMVWDLREPSNMHQHHTVDGDTLLVRVPTFSTDGILSEDAHNSGVVTLLPIVTAEDSLRASMPQGQQTAEVSDSSFQIASLEERGVIHFWVVLEIAKTSLAGSESELGLVPGGRVKLIRSSTISLHSPSRSLDSTNSFKSVCMQLNPADPSHFYIGTDKGVVLHASRHHDKVHPKEYKAHIDVPVEVSHLDFSPFNLSCFLVGCMDGSIRLHSLGSELPLLTWPNSTMGMEVTAIAWSHSRPSVFFSVDTTSKVYVWSLLEKDGNPVKTEQFSNGRLTGLDVSNDFSASSMGRPGRKPELVIADEKGGIEVHRLNERFSSASGDELDAMAALLESFV